MTKETLYIYHTNDIHSHLRNWPRMAKYLRNQRSHHEAKGETVFSFDIGDASDRAHAFAEATDGQGIVQLLNRAAFDGATIGNNEGIGNSKDQLNHLYDEANFQVVLSNIKDIETGNIPDWAKEIMFLETSKGLKLGVIGLTIPLEMSYKPLGWQIFDPILTLRDMVEKYQKQVDGFILLSHLGLDYDREIAEKFPMDVILGAHTHHTLPHGEWVNGSFLGAAGRYGEYVGKMKLCFTKEGIKEGQAELLDTNTDLPVNKDEKELGDQYVQIGHELLRKQVIATIPDTLEVSWQGESDLVKVGLEAVAHLAEVDLAILNAGLFLRPLLQGKVTKDDLHRCLPHPMRVMKVKMTGKHMRLLIKNMESKRTDLRALKLKGIGFRGEIFGEICYKNIEYNPKTEEVLIKGEPLDDNKDYRFATVDHYWFAPFFLEIDKYGVNEILFPDFIRTVLGNYLQRKYNK